MSTTMPCLLLYDRWLQYDHVCLHTMSLKSPTSLLSQTRED